MRKRLSSREWQRRAVLVWGGLLLLRGAVPTGSAAQLAGWGEVVFPVDTHGAKFVRVAAGAYHSVALSDDGRAIAWGDNSQRQSDVPAGLTGVVGIAAGEYHSLALKGDGTVVARGANRAGQTDVPLGLTGVVFCMI